MILQLMLYMGSYLALKTIDWQLVEDSIYLELAATAINQEGVPLMWRAAISCGQTKF